MSNVYAVRVLAILMDNPDGVSVVELKQRAQGKEKVDQSFDRLISDLLGLGCAYICRYQNHIPVLRLQEKRFSNPNSPDTYSGMERGFKKGRFPGIRYSVKSTVVFEGKRLSAWAACQLSGIPYQSLWTAVNANNGHSTDEMYQEAFDKLFEAKRVAELTGSRREVVRLDHRRPDPKPTTYSNTSSVFNVRDSGNRIGSIQVDPE